MNYVCTSPVYMSHPHNFPLQIAAEWGLPAALAACLLFGILLWRATRSLRNPSEGTLEDRALSGLLLTGILAAALHACVSGVLVMPASQVTGLLICGLFLGLAPRAVCSTPNRGAARTLGAGLLLSAGLLILGVHELRTMPERSAQMRPGEDLRPRIWQDAKVCRLYVQQFDGTN
jgi:O-antigen ligase